MTPSTLCRVCGNEGDILARRGRSVTSESKILELPSELRLCRRCGHLYTALALDLPSYYAQQYDAALTDEGLDEIVSTDDGAIVFRTDLDYALFQRHLAGRISAGDSVFEYGCGRGRILSRLRKDGYRNLWAYDVSELYREPVMGLVGAARLALGKRPAPKPEGQRHRLACSFFVLEHDGEPVDSLRYLHSVLEPGGLLYLMVPNYRTNLADLACADHVNHFCGTFLETLLSRLGFEVLVRDDTSAIGASILLARACEAPEGSALSLALADTAMHSAARDASGAFIDALARLDRLPARLPSNRPVFLYGSGFYATLATSVLDAAGRTIAGVFDANPRKQGLQRLGKRVCSPDEIAPGEHTAANLLVCVNAAIAPQIGERFRGSFHEVVLL